MPESEITKLRRARRRVHWQLNKLEPIVDGYRAKLAKIEARIQELDPQLWLPPRRYQPNPHFERRELPRLVMQIMREANGPISVGNIARRALALKGCTLPGPGTMKQARTRISQTLAKWTARGLVATIGRGNGTRRALRTSDITR